MIPLWIIAIFPDWDKWGWAFLSQGTPCVAHRVWPIPIVPLVSWSSLYSSSIETYWLSRNLFKIHPSRHTASPVTLLGDRAQLIWTTQFLRNNCAWNTRTLLLELTAMTTPSWPFVKIDESTWPLNLASRNTAENGFCQRTKLQGWENFTWFVLASERSMLKSSHLLPGTRELLLITHTAVSWSWSLRQLTCRPVSCGVTVVSAPL